MLHKSILPGVKCAIDCFSTCKRPRIFNIFCGLTKSDDLSYKTNIMFSASAQEAAFAKRKRRGAGPRALLRGVWGLNKLPTCHLIGRPTNKSELKIRVRPDCKWKIFWTTKIFSAYNHNNIPQKNRKSFFEVAY